MARKTLTKFDLNWDWSTAHSSWSVARSSKVDATRVDDLFNARGLLGFINLDIELGDMSQPEFYQQYDFGYQSFLQIKTEVDSICDRIAEINERGGWGDGLFEADGSSRYWVVRPWGMPKLLSRPDGSVMDQLDGRLALYEVERKMDADPKRWGWILASIKTDVATTVNPSAVSGIVPTYGYVIDQAIYPTIESALNIGVPLIQTKDGD